MDNNDGIARRTRPVTSRKNKNAAVLKTKGKRQEAKAKRLGFLELMGLGSRSETEALHIYVQRQFSRIVAHGIEYDVASRVVSRIACFEEWAPEWAREGKYWEKLAVGALRHGHRTTAQDAFFKASNCFRVGQHILHADKEKMAYYPKVTRLYETAGKLMEPAMQTVSIRSPQGTLPAYFSIPAGGGRFPAVILVGGADGWREEYLPSTVALLKRGFAVLNVDAPGQGAARLLRKTFMPVDVEKSLSAAVDFLLQCPKVQPRRIFMLGHSVGGYLTLRAAATDHRLAACATLGAPYELLSIFDNSPPARRINFSLMCGTRDLDKGRDILRHFTLDGLLSKISCPVLVIHGKKDSVVPAAHVDRICSGIGAHVELRTWDDGIHCCDNYVAETYPLVADWLADHMPVLRRRT